MNRLYILMICVFAVFSGKAQIVSVESAQLVGNNFMQRQSNHLQQKSAGNMELAYTAQTASQQKSGDSIPCFYVFNRPEGGFVIVAASENIVPILAYSDQGRFEAEGVPDNMLGVLRAMQEEIGDAILSRIAAAPKVQTQWENLKQQKAADYNQLADAVEPLTSHLYWDQWPYFNDSCPYDASVSSNGHRCPAGCTATAMAIVMRYWRYPTHGSGSHSYTHNTYGIQYANFGNTSYNYDNMPEYLPAFPRAFQRQALGQLLYHCGVSVNMNYSSSLESFVQEAGRAGRDRKMALSCILLADYKLVRINRETGITFIFVTHDQEEALSMSDTIVVMNQGYIQQVGTPENIYNEPENAFVADFIGDSNIIDGVMVRDKLVRILGREYACSAGKSC